MGTYIRKAGAYLWHSVVLVAVLLWVLTALWGLSYYRTIQQRRAAERLLRELPGLDSSEQGWKNAQQIAKKFK